MGRVDSQSTGEGKRNFVRAATNMYEMVGGASGRSRVGLYSCNPAELGVAALLRSCGLSIIFP